MTHAEEQSEPRVFEAEFRCLNFEDGKVNLMVFSQQGVPNSAMKIPLPSMIPG
jgi:hypothetical protein